MFIRKAAKIAHSRQTNNQEELRAALGDPQAAAAYRHGQRAKTFRTAIFMGGALALVGVGIHNLSNIVDGLKGAVAHEDIQARVQGQLRKVTVPNKAILVEGEGSGSASVNVRTESSVPVVGGIFNRIVAPLTDMNAYAKRDGKIQIISQNNAISLSAVKAPAPNTGTPQWQIRADVAADKLSTQTGDMHYGIENGKQQLSAGNDLLSMATVKGVTKRNGWVTDWADRSFQNNCGKALRTDIAAGVQKFAQDTVRASAKVVVSSGQDASLLDLLAKRHVVVSFNAPGQLADGTSSRQEITANQIKLPTAFVPNSKFMADQLGKSTDDVRIETGAGDCVFTTGAVQDQMRITGGTKSNPGV